MKKEIARLLQSEEGTLKVNKFCRLVRHTKNAFNEDVDVLKIEFSIHHCMDFSKSIKSRDLAGIVEEIAISTQEAFDIAKEQYIKELQNGYIG